MSLRLRWAYSQDLTGPSSSPPSPCCSQPSRTSPTCTLFSNALVAATPTPTAAAMPRLFLRLRGAGSEGGSYCPGFLGNTWPTPIGPCGREAKQAFLAAALLLQLAQHAPPRTRRPADPLESCHRTSTSLLGSRGRSASTHDRRWGARRPTGADTSCGARSKHSPTLR